MIYKLTFLLLLWGLKRGRKIVSEHGFQTLETPRIECELNHALECQTLRVIKSQAKRAFWKEILKISNYTKVDTIESRKHASRGSSR